MKDTGFIKPMLAKTGEQPFDDADWIYEIKFDGYRAIAELKGLQVKLYSRNGLAFNEDYPGITKALIKLNLRAVFDGEIVALDKKGRSHFQLLQQIAQNPSVPVVYYVFDLLRLDGKNTEHLPLVERKKLLQKILPGNKTIRYSDHVEQEGIHFFRLLAKQDQEGMIAKRAGSIYREGKRSGDWQKIKHHHEQEAIIVGFTAPKKSRKFFGSLLLGVYKNEKLTYAGHAGTGFDEETLGALFRRMLPLKTAASPFRESIAANGPVTWLKPKLVCQVKFTEWTTGGLMRHPVFMGLRKDKEASEVVKEGT